MKYMQNHFSHFLDSDPERLHFVAHSHHPWPDVTRAAHMEAWDLAAREIDDKWGTILGMEFRKARGFMARELGLTDHTTIAIAPNTHEFISRILSCFPPNRKTRILTTDGEFHSFNRQIARLEESDLVLVKRVPVEPHATFEERFAEAAREGKPDLIWLSHVFYNSGFAVTKLEEIAKAAGPKPMMVVDGYHHFMARPTDISALADRAFYIAGGYKYTMAGEGICFMHCPPGWGSRPLNTGWFADFGNLEKAKSGEVGYSEDGWRFMGATFEPSGLLRFNAVMKWLDQQKITVEMIHQHALKLQKQFLDKLPGGLEFLRDHLVVTPDEPHGNFLTFDLPEAEDIYRRLKEANVMTDVRGTCLRFGFGIYQTTNNVTELHNRLARHVAPAYKNRPRAAARAQLEP